MKRACLLGGTLFFAKSAEIGKKMLDKTANPLYNLKAVKNAAIAQSVERILGKDEVASSNLASSSKASEIFGFQRLTFLKRFWGKKHRRVFDGFSVLFDIFRTFLTDKTGI